MSQKRTASGLAGGEQLGYDQLLIATGARLYAPLAGADLPGIYNFKSLSAAENLVGKVRLGQAKSALIVGAGFIGMEIALLLSELGVKVTQIEMLDQVMATMLDAETACHCRRPDALPWCGFTLKNQGHSLCRK